MFLKFFFEIAIVNSCSTYPPTPGTKAPTPAVQCKEDSDCQDNAGCFLIEPIELDPITFEPRTTCQCFLGYLLDNSTASFPKTGFCENLRTRACTGDTSKDYCVTNTEGWGVCPYCRVWILNLFPIQKTNNNPFKAFKFQGDYGGELSLGTYTSGEGIFDSDPMMFERGDSINCGNSERRSTKAYWYCWYTAFPDPPVPLDTM